MRPHDHETSRGMLAAVSDVQNNFIVIVHTVCQFLAYELKQYTDKVWQNVCICLKLIDAKAISHVQI